MKTLWERRERVSGFAQNIPVREDYSAIHNATLKAILQQAY